MMQHLAGSIGTILVVMSALLLLTAALHDVVARTVPNGLALTLALAGLGTRLLDGTILHALAAAALVFAAAVLVWRLGFMGGGDVKLLGAGALAVPPADVPTFVTIMTLAGGVLAIVYLIGRALPGPAPTPRPDSLVARAMRAERWRLGRGGPLPYACAIAAGGLFVLL